MNIILFIAKRSDSNYIAFKIIISQNTRDIFQNQFSGLILVKKETCFLILQEGFQKHNITTIMLPTIPKSCLLF